MKKIFSSVLSAFFTCLIASAQPALPKLPVVLKEFFKNYSYTRDNEHSLNFAKKKKGWFVEYLNLYTKETVSSELFWSVDDGGFKILKNPDDATPKSPEEIEKIFSDYITANMPPYLAYGYERCRYFGYNEWEEDMINDFGNDVPENDTLLEGLARAYSNYSSHYLWYETGGYHTNNDMLQRPLKKSEMPAQARIDKVKYYISKSIELYKILAQHNPYYQTLVGNSTAKLFNEQMHLYMNLQMSNYPKDAQAVLKTMNVPSYIKQLGYNYLAPCAHNSILITYGDMDNYPLVYVQQAENYRKDVTVINNSLLGLAPYIRMLQENKLVKFSTQPEDYANDNFEYFFHADKDSTGGSASQTLSAFLKTIQNHTYPLDRDENIRTYPFKKIIVPVDPVKYKVICNQNNLGKKIEMNLESTLLVSEFLIADILQSNLYTRPLYFTFTATPAHFNQDYLQNEGTVIRLLPADQNKKTQSKQIEAAKIENNFIHLYKPVYYYKDNSKTRQMEINDLTSATYYTLINFYSGAGNKEKLKSWIERYLENIKKNNPVYAYTDMQSAVTLISAGFTKPGTAILESYAVELVNNYLNYSSLDYYISRIDLENLLIYMKNIGENNSVKISVIDELLKKIEK